MCYSLFDKEWRARKESAKSELTTKSKEEQAAVASRKAADKAFADYLASLQKRFAGRKQKESV